MVMTNRQVGSRCRLYSLFGLFLGVLAPIGWAFLRLIVFWDANLSIIDQVTGDVFASFESQLRYAYMGGGTALVLAFLGYQIGRRTEDIHTRAEALDKLNKTIDEQKNIYEKRFTDLNAGIKNFHTISSQIQKTLDRDVVLNLTVDGLHNVLGYDRVNLFLVDRENNCLRAVAMRGETVHNIDNITLPLDQRAGSFYKVIKDGEILLVEDISELAQEYHLQPPCDVIKQLRSKSFIICPIIVRGEVVGLYGVDNRFSGKPLNDSDADTVKLFADQVATTLTKIRMINVIETLTGELEHTFKELLKFREEHRRLDLALNQATTSTGEAISEISDAAGVVHEAVDATRSTASEMSATIEEVSENLGRLTDCVDKSISAMTEISATIKSVEENSSRSHDMSQTVMERAEVGARAVTDTLTGLQGISSAVESAVAAIERLLDKGDEIGNITTVINEITQKTNLLALNAAIIAAQAGEHGRSFAVVADEVRNLSQEAADSTGAIEQIISEIQMLTQETVHNISQTRTLVNEGVKLGHGMEESLRDILDSAFQAMNMSSEMSVATQEVSRSADSVSHSITELGDMASRISTASREQTLATHNIAEAIEEIKRLTDDMVEATETQKSNTRDIESAVGSVSSMATRIFSEIENRQKGSHKIIESLEALKGVTD